MNMEDKTEQKRPEKEQGKQDISDLQRLVVSPNLMKAYLLNLLKAVIFIAGTIGAFYFIILIAGENPFIEIFETIGIPFLWVKWALTGFFALFFILIIFNTLSLTSYELIFEGDTLTYSYGSFFKVTKSTEIANTIRVNYKEYKPMKIGDIIVGFTDTDKKDIVVQYVDKVKEQCDIINKIIHFKQAQEAQEMLENGVE